MAFHMPKASVSYPRTRARPLRDQGHLSPSPAADLNLDDEQRHHVSISLSESQPGPNQTLGYRHDYSESDSSSNEGSIPLLLAPLLPNPLASSAAARSERVHGPSPQRPCRTVYLGNIRSGTSAEKILDNVKHGQIEYIRLFPNKNYAFISFLDEDHAARFHYDPMVHKLVINGQRVKIGWGTSHQIPPRISFAVENFGASRSVYLDSLPDVTEDELREDVERFGGIDTIKISPGGRSALVHYLSIESALNAVSTLPLSPKWQHPCQISYGYDRCATMPKQQLKSGDHGANPSTPTQSPTSATIGIKANKDIHNVGNRTIYMGNIHSEATTKDICDIVKGGSLQHIRYIPHKHICFTIFIKSAAAASFFALGTLKSVEILGQRIQFGWGEHSGRLPPAIESAIRRGASRKVCIYNLGTNCTEEQLYADFCDYGEIESIEFSSENKSAFINFTDISNAIEVMELRTGNEGYKSCKFSFGIDRCDLAASTFRSASSDVVTTPMPHGNAKESQEESIDVQHDLNAEERLSSALEDHPIPWNLPENSQRDVQGHPQSYILHFIAALLSSLMQYSRNFTRPRSKQGYKRLEWVCDCGNYLYADFAESGHNGIRETMNKLQATEVGTTAGSRTISNQRDSVSMQRSTENIYSQHMQMPRRGLDIKRHDQEQNQFMSPSEQPVLNANKILSDTASSQPRKRFVELCVNTGEFQRQLGEIDVSDVENDAQLFDRIKKRYLEIRGFRVKYFLLKPIDVHYVQFSLEDRHRVGILDKPMAIPSQEEMASEGYGYHPCPLKPPPVPANIFLHHLQLQHPHRRLIWGKRIPQKLNQSILQMQTDEELVVGWGVHIIEGLNKFTALAMALAMLCVSAIVSVTWTVVRDDVQGGFGIGAWLTSVQAIVMMMVLTKWNEL